jgi:hypothetical protein
MPIGAGQDWLADRVQNPSSVRSNRTGGTLVTSVYSSLVWVLGMAWGMTCRRIMAATRSGGRQRATSRSAAALSASVSMQEPTR